MTMAVSTYGEYVYNMKIDAEKMMAKHEAYHNKWCKIVKFGIDPGDTIVVRNCGVYEVYGVLYHLVSNEIAVSQLK